MVFYVKLCETYATNITRVRFYILDTVADLNIWHLITGGIGYPDQICIPSRL